MDMYNNTNSPKLREKAPVFRLFIVSLDIHYVLISLSNDMAEI